MKVKQKVTIDGAEREIEFELDPNQYMTVDQHRRELRPLQQQLEAATKELDQTRFSQLVSELESAFLTGDGNLRVKKGVARKLAELEASRGVFGFNSEHRMWAVKDGEGFAYAATVTKERPYKGALDFAAEFVKDRANADFVERTSQQRPGVNTGNGGGLAGNVRSRADFKSAAEKVKWIGENGRDAFMALPEK